MKALMFYSINVLINKQINKLIEKYKPTSLSNVVKIGLGYMHKSFKSLIIHPIRNILFTNILRHFQEINNI